jgi:hypothetical protein
MMNFEPQNSKAALPFEIGHSAVQYFAIRFELQAAAFHASPGAPQPHKELFM